MTLRVIQCLALMVTLTPNLLPAADPEPTPQPLLLEVPFKLLRDYIIVVQGSIRGIQKRHFLIDTGAVPSVVDTRLVKKLRLGGSRQQMSVFTDIIEVQHVLLPNLELGPIKLKQLPVAVQDLRFIEREIGVRIDAIIGLDVLGWSNLAIDYNGKKLLFGVRIPDAPKVALELGPGCMLLPVQIDGRGVRLMIDTGAKDLMFFESRFRAHFPNLKATGRREFSNMGGIAHLKEVLLDSLEIGKTRLGSRSAVLINSTADSTPNFDGLLGLRSLGAGRVYFDFNQQLMSWTGRWDQW